MKVRIIPMGNVPQEAVRNISEQLKEVYPPVLGGVEFGTKLGVPSEAYDSTGISTGLEFLFQYVSSKVLPTIERKILAVTSEDLYCQGLNFVFGQA